MEENKTLMPPKEQALETERDAKAEELESTFSYDGYQVVAKRTVRSPPGPGNCDSKRQHHIQHSLHQWIGRCGLCTRHVQQ